MESELEILRESQQAIRKPWLELQEQVNDILWLEGPFTPGMLYSKPKKQTVQVKCHCAACGKAHVPGKRRIQEGSNA